MARLLEPASFTVQKIKVVPGKPLATGERSSTGLYGIVSHPKERLLRVALHQEVAELLCDYSSRRVVECSIQTQGGPCVS